MNHDHPVTAQSLTAVEIDGVVGEAGYLETLPGAHHIDVKKDGAVVIWLEALEVEPPPLDEVRPERPPEIELHGQGAPCPALVNHPQAQHVEMFFDGLGDPVAAPRGWWHARVWLKAA